MGGDVKNDDIEILKGNVAELALFNVDCPVADTLLIVAKLSVRHMALTGRVMSLISLWV